MHVKTERKLIAGVKWFQINNCVVLAPLILRPDIKMSGPSALCSFDEGARFRGIEMPGESDSLDTLVVLWQLKLVYETLKLASLY